MDRERAETFLRLLVEAELRRLAEQPGDLAAQAGCITRVIQVARALIAVRALGDEVAGQVLDDFELALGRWQAWPPGRAGRDLRSLTRSTPPRGSPAAPDLAVAVGQVIPVRDEQVSGEATVLSYAHTESGALLTIVAQPGQLSPVDPEGPWHTMPGPSGVRRRGLLMIPFRQFTATDDWGIYAERPGVPRPTDRSGVPSRGCHVDAPPPSADDPQPDTTWTTRSPGTRAASSAIAISLHSVSDIHTGRSVALEKLA
jgi:hypothetical protein